MKNLLLVAVASVALICCVGCGGKAENKIVTSDDADGGVNTQENSSAYEQSMKDGGGVSAPPGN